jgi:hypothetical protein
MENSPTRGGSFFSIINHLFYSRGFQKLGLDVKTKHADELTDAVEITEAVDEEQQMQDEVCRAQRYSTFHELTIYISSRD